MGESDSEAELVDSAYADQVKLLFKTLVGELTGRGGVPGPNEEQQCLQRFKAGLALARRARELTLSAIAPAAAPRASAPIAASPRTRSGAGTKPRRSRTRT